MAKTRRASASKRNDDDPLYDALTAPWRILRQGFSAAVKALREDKWAKLTLLIVIAAAVLRLMRPDWYVQRQFHPDERWLFGVTAPLSYPAMPGQAQNDPAGLQYGSLPLYSVAAVKDVAMLFNRNLPVYDWVRSWGRSITGLVDVLTVFLVFLLGARLFNRRVGALAALLLAFTPLNIQLAHFFTVDPWMSCMAVATLLASAQAARSHSWGWSVASGVAYGAALACKTAALPLALPILLAHVWPVLAPGLAQKVRAERMKDQAMNLGIAVGAALLAFFVFMPGAFMDWAKFTRNQAEQRNILVTGSPEGTPYVRQYWDTAASFHIKNLVFYYQGIALGLISLLSVAYYLFSPLRLLPRKAEAKLVKGRKIKLVASPSWDWHREAFAPALILSWVLPYFAIVGLVSFAKFARYMLPLTPFLALLAVAALDELAKRFPERAKLSRWALGLMLLVTLGYGLGYGGTYLRKHPWISASEWIFDKVPLQVSENGSMRRSRIYNENWGDDLPVEVSGRHAGFYDNRKVDIVQWDNPAKLEHLGQVLEQADILVMADARAYGTYLRIPTRFPLTHAYFDILTKDPARLGFERAYESSNRMRWFGMVEINDSRVGDKPVSLWADESFTLYDRPHALLLRKVRPITADEAKATLQAHIQELGLPDLWRQGRGPEEIRRAAAGFSPSTAGAETKLNPNLGLSRGKMVKLLHPAPIWYLLTLWLGLLALPLAYKVMGRFPDGGYALSRALGVFLFAWLAYNLAWLKALPFHQSTLWLLLLTLSAGVVAWGWRKRRQALEFWRDKKREIIWAEAVFALGFFAFLIIRSFNPNIHDTMGQGYFGGGEPLGMTYLSAVTRCSTFPVYDPWLSGHNSSYYYFGYVMAGSLAKLSGFVGGVGYNMSLTLFFSLTLLSAYGLTRALGAARRFALVGAGAVTLFGALSSVSFVAQGAAGNPSLGGFFNSWISHSFIWDPTRFPQLARFLIFEFPYFSYLYGDLHPHNMVLPFGLLLTAFLLAIFKSSGSGLKALGATRSGQIVMLLLLALLLDAQWAINTWNYPVFAALSLGALLVGTWVGREKSVGARLKAAVVGLGIWVAMLLLGRLLMLGFRLYFIQDSGNRLGTVQTPERALSAYIPSAYFVFGLLGLATLAALRLRAYLQSEDKLLKLKLLGRKPLDQAAFKVLSLLMNKRPLRFWLFVSLLGLGLLAWVMAMPGLASSSLLIFATGLLLLSLAFFSLRAYHDANEAFLWMLGIFSMCLVVGAELKFVADRTNTIFKFWMNAWVFMGLIFGTAMGRYAQASESSEPVVKKGKASRKARMRERLAVWLGGVGVFIIVFGVAFFDVSDGNGGRYAYSTGLVMLLALAAGLPWLLAKTWTRPLWRGLLWGFVALGLFYPLGATLARVNLASGFKDPHLDGLAFLKQRQMRSLSPEFKDYDKDDAVLIDWLNQEADKTEVLLEAPGIEMYKGLSRFSIYTGLPTVLGWEYQIGQQLGQRAGQQLGQRQADVEAIYREVDRLRSKALLDKYSVRWVVVGAIERKLYPAEGLAKFAAWGEVAARSGESLLYKINEAPKP